MKLTEMTLNDYLGALASDAPAPGGGSASALCGAQGAGLVAMVAGLSLGKKKYEADQELCTAVQAQCLSLKADLSAQVDIDTEAFNGVSAAFKLPKETDQQKTARSAAIQAATLEATRVPFKTMELGLAALHQAEKLVGHSNTNAASDLGVAAQNLGTCVRGAWLNVLINLGSLKDEEAVARFTEQGAAIVREAKMLSEEIFKAIELIL